MGNLTMDRSFFLFESCKLDLDMVFLICFLIACCYYCCINLSFYCYNICYCNYCCYIFLFSRSFFVFLSITGMILMISSGCKLSSDGALSLPLLESPQLRITLHVAIISSAAACFNAPPNPPKSWSSLLSGVITINTYNFFLSKSCMLLVAG